MSYNITMDRQIIYYYRRGVASYLIAKKFGVSNEYVRKLLRGKGIPLRGHKQTNKMSAQKRTPEENRRITEAAAEANRGSVHTESHRNAIALSRQQKPSVDPTYEKPLVELCRELGVEVIPQKAFSKYNVDLYLSKENVVIEIFGGGFHNKKQVVQVFNDKLAYLKSQKIPVVIVWADQDNYDPKKVLRVSRKAKGLVIIDGSGKPTTRGLKDIVY